MNDVHIELFLTLIIMVALFWMIPHRFRMVLVSLITLLFIAYQSIASILFLIISSSVTFFSAQKIDKSQHDSTIMCIHKLNNPKYIMGITIALLVCFFIFLRTYSHQYLLPVIIGLAYSTCRQIHFLMDAYRGAIATFSVKNYFIYQFYLPVIYAGPIHRYEHFIRQIERSSFDYGHFSQAIERVIYGYLKLIVISSYFIDIKLASFVSMASFHGAPLWILYSKSCLQWLSLYMAFSGLTDIALGFSSMMGLKLEENFNKPYQASNLIDFWQRWHISLTRWVREYVFMPVFLTSRSQIIGVFASLFVIAIWHEVSFNYLFWGGYQAIGILLCRVYQNSKDVLSKLPRLLEITIKRFLTFLWLVSYLPLVSFLGFKT